MPLTKARQTLGGSKRPQSFLDNGIRSARTLDQALQQRQMVGPRGELGAGKTVAALSLEAFNDGGIFRVTM